MVTNIILTGTLCHTKPTKRPNASPQTNWPLHRPHPTVNYMGKDGWICRIVCPLPPPTGDPDSKVYGANMGPTWVLSAPDGPHVGPMNLGIRELMWTELTPTQLDLYSLRKHRLIGINIPVINPKWSSDRLRFIMGIHIPVRRCLFSE